MCATRIGVRMLLLQRCALRKFHVTDGQNKRDQIAMGGKRWKHVWLNCIILSGRSPNERWEHTRDAWVITTWRLGLRAPPVSPAIMTKMTLLQNSRMNENWALIVARRFNKLVHASQERSSLSLVLANQNQGKK